MKKRTLKGFTLLELIIVLALFSVIMVGAMSLISPVSKISKKARNNENSYAYVDNIQNYLQDTLEFSDHLWVYQGNMSDSDLADEAFEFKKYYYNDLVNAKEDKTLVYGDCTIRVLTILNNDTAGYKKGQILMQTVNYTTNPAAPKGSLGTAVPQINDAVFSDQYMFDYVLGAGTLVNAEEGYLALDNIYKTAPSLVPSSLTPSNFALSIVTYSTKKDDNDRKAKSLVINREIDEFTHATADFTIREYPLSTHYTVANIPLFNVIERGGNKANEGYWTKGAVDPIEHKKLPGKSGFIADSSKITMGQDDNIYIIYAMADEIAVANGKSESV